ncbi:MAG: hypothetical protein QOG01_2495 [Pseudonocardiales bacterium]|jgi:hypothetical protein|nr:hypothetical protein [Pseudonocardiales bacterium]
MPLGRGLNVGERDQRRVINGCGHDGVTAGIDGPWPRR